VGARRRANKKGRSVGAGEDRGENCPGDWSEGGEQGEIQSAGSESWRAVAGPPFLGKMWAARRLLRPVVAVEPVAVARPSVRDELLAAVGARCAR
jgi:hypothetical protein